MIVFRLKTFTQYDDTDNLKRMKDSDILAEKEKTVPSYSSSVLPKAAAGAAIGAVGLGAFKGIRKATSNAAAGNRMAALGKGMKSGAKWGAAIGAVALGAAAMKKRKQERDAAEFYNDRLKYAQTQAKRREKIDWKQNMTQREGYSF